MSAAYWPSLLVVLAGLAATVLTLLIAPDKPVTFSVGMTFGGRSRLVAVSR